jgi:GNAT superfamily N-acetyltransferase
MNPDEAIQEAVHEILRRYNRAHFETDDERDFSIVVRDGSDAIVGGLNGTLFGQWLEINVLAVDERCRGQGVGRALLAQAERQALDDGCRYALLTTFGFQGRDYYPKFGYRQIGEIEGYPLTGSQHWFVKDLAQAGPAEG